MILVLNQNRTGVLERAREFEIVRAGLQMFEAELTTRVRRTGIEHPAFVTQ